MASDIFISYAREDSRFAGALADALQARGWSVWWDRVIPPGKTWDEVIEIELTAARAVIVIWSRHSIRSRWVRAEATEAIERNTLIPVRVDDVAPPLAFRHVHAADLIAWSGDAREERLLQLFNALGNVVPAAVRPSSSGLIEKESSAQEAPAMDGEDGTVRRITDLYNDWQHSSDKELAMLAELEIRETLGRYLEWRGENRRQADEGDFQGVIATMRRLGWLR